MLDLNLPDATLQSPNVESTFAEVDNVKFAMEDRNDLGRLRQRFKKQGRLQVQNFLTTDSARVLSASLQSHKPWNLVTDFNGRHVDLDINGMAKLSAVEQTEFENTVHAQARENFQYLFANYPIYDTYHKGTLKNAGLMKAFMLLNSKEFLDFARHICADSTISFADAQATRYEAGHFLTEHDDNVEGKNRRCAFVLSMTPHWRPDWGGLLQFFGKNGNIDQG